MKILLSALLLSGISPGLLQAGSGKQPAPGAPGPAPVPHVSSLWAVDVETGVLWRASNNTFLDYTVVPVIISLRTPAHARLDLGAGELTLRARFSLLAEAVAEGPESAYFGFSASPSLEYWFTKGGNTCLYAGAGGGFGWIDSQGVPGGQGQDFTLNWFATAGIRHYFFDHALSLHAGAMFQHWSNGGATDPNPGLDALGPVIGASWHF